MKLALMMSGHPRLYDDTFSSWNTNLFTHHDVDIFFHMWETRGYKDASMIHAGGIVQDTLVDINHLRKIWNPTKLVMETYNDYHEQFVEYTNQWFALRDKFGLLEAHRPISNTSMYYKWWACNQLRLEYEIQTSTKYDCVILSRPDIYLEDELPSEIFENQPKLYFGCAGWSSSVQADFLSDFIVAGNSECMSYWCSIYPNLDQKLMESLKLEDFDMVLNPHKLFHHHAMTAPMPFDELFINVVKKT